MQSYRNALLNYIKHPEKFEKGEVPHFDQWTVTVRDAFPKAKHHFLVMPRREINSLQDLSKEHIILLEAIREQCELIVSTINQCGTYPKESISETVNTYSSEVPAQLSNAEDKKKELALPQKRKLGQIIDFKIGVHAIPSMHQVHVHVISTDFVSDKLKHKKHWNSFTTDFFIGIDKLIDIIEIQGCVKIDGAKYGKLLRMPLQCHHCHMDMKNMPELKKHIEGCSV